MKKFNQELHDDITKLRGLAKSSRKEYLKLYNELPAKHNMSKATLYRELKKPEPGNYQKRPHKPNMSKITRDELDRVARLIVERKSNEQIMKVMSRVKKFEYTYTRLAKVKQKISLEAHLVNNPKPKIIHHIYDPKMIDGMKISKVSYIRADGKSGITPKDQKVPAYKGNASKFFCLLCGIDTTDPEIIQKLSFPNGDVHYVKNSVIKEALALVATSSEAGGKSKQEAVNHSIDVLLLNQLNIAKQRGYITPLELRQLASTTRVLTQVRDSAAPPGGYYTFEELMHVVGVFSPSVTREKVAQIIASHPFLDRSRNKPVPAYTPSPAADNVSPGCSDNPPGEIKDK